MRDFALPFATQLVSHEPIPVRAGEAEAGPTLLMVFVDKNGRPSGGLVLGNILHAFAARSLRDRAVLHIGFEDAARCMQLLVRPITVPKSILHR